MPGKKLVAYVQEFQSAQQAEDIKILLLLNKDWPYIKKWDQGDVALA